MSTKIAKRKDNHSPSLVAGAPSVVLAAAQGRLNQRASSQTVLHLAEIVADNDTQTQRLVATLHEDLVKLERRVHVLEHALASERSKHGRFSWSIWGAIRRALRSIWTTFRGRD